MHVRHLPSLGLEQSLNVPGFVARVHAATPERDQVVARVKELMDKELLAMADDIATHPEIGFEERRSIGKLADYLRQHNFSIETGSGGLATAWASELAPSHPTLGDVDSAQALADYQAAKRAHKAELRSKSAR